jgi:hypothetical protein
VIFANPLSSRSVKAYQRSSSELQQEQYMESKSRARLESLNPKAKVRRSLDLQCARLFCVPVRCPWINFHAASNVFSSLQTSSSSLQYDGTISTSASGDADIDQTQIQAQQFEERCAFRETVIVHTDKVERQAAAIQSFERDIGQIQEMFQDLNMLVTEQGVGIDNIESNVASTKASTKIALKDIQTAAQTQKDTPSCSIS